MIKGDSRKLEGKNSMEGVPHPFSSLVKKQKESTRAYTQRAASVRLRRQNDEKIQHHQTTGARCCTEEREYEGDYEPSVLASPRGLGGRATYN